MRRFASVLAVLVALAAAGSGGYALGVHGFVVPANILHRLPWLSGAAHDPAAPLPATSPHASKAVIYYRDPDGKPDYSAEAKTTPDGRPFLPVYENEEVGFEQASAARKASPSPSATRRILYYRNPMGLPDTSPTPKKDPMGMDYIPVYEGEDDDGTTVKLSPGKLQRIGVESAPVTRRVIAEPVRAPGTIQLDERRISVISLRSEAFVDSVENVTTGSVVRKDQPLMRLYSPTISTAAAQYLATLGFRGEAASQQGGRQRMLNLAVPQQLLTEIERTREIPLNFTWVAPRDGIVLERNVSDGMRVMPGDVLFKIADHSVMWALVDVAERDLAAVEAGQAVTVKVRSYPDRSFAGKVTLVYPQLIAATRSARVRIELLNSEFLLHPDMYATAEILTGGNAPVLAVPDSAVIDSGDRQVVLIDKGEGRFEPRPVRLGRRGAGFVEIKDGVSEGDTVVTSANFLIDAESNLKAALKSLSKAGAPQ